MNIAVRSRTTSILLLLAALLATLLPVGSAQAAESKPIVPPSNYIVGGCRIVFDSDGDPRATGTSHKPCVGVTSLRHNSRGDLDITLTPESSQRAIRLLVMPDNVMAGRGIVAGVTGGHSWITVRFYDDRVGRRLNLTKAADRYRLRSSAVTVGWTKDGGGPTAGVDPGYNALDSNRDRTATAETTVPGGCVIRIAADKGPWVHANATHRCVGVKSVGINSRGEIQVIASDEQRGAVVNVQGDADETLTVRGISVGVSVSATVMNFRLYDSRLNRRLDLRNASDLRRVSGRYSNMWLTWTKTTSRPGSPAATRIAAHNKYGPYRDGSAAPDGVFQRGCSIDFSTNSANPRITSNFVRVCTGVSGLRFTDSGDLVAGGPSKPIVGTTSIGSRSLTDYGIRVGLSGGMSSSEYSFYSWKLGRELKPSNATDRSIFQRSGSSILLGWTHVAN